MLKSQLLFAALALGCLCACSDTTIDEKNKTYIPDQVVLIIDQCPDYSSYRHEVTGVWSSTEAGYEIMSIDSNQIKHTYSTSKVPTRDTVVFPTKNDFVEIEHIYNLYEHLSFIFQKGDTALFTYENGFPEATIVNREISYTEVNYEKVRRDFILKDDEPFDGNSQFNIHPLSSVKGYLKIRDPLKQREIISTKMKTGYRQAKRELSMEQLLLDSLLEYGHITEELHDFYQTKSQVEYDFLTHKFKTELEKGQGTSEQNFSDWSIKNIDDKNLSKYGYYSRILEYVEREAYYKAAPWVHQVSQRFPDYRVVYDTIKSSNFFSKEDLEVLLTKNMHLIIEHFPEKDVKVYFKKFVVDVKNKALLENTLIKYQHTLSSELLSSANVLSDLNSKSDSLFSLSLQNQNGELIDFQDLLSQNEGKLLYIDFWASHCVPCLVSMPYSKELVQQYQEEDITFVYISIDKKPENWKRAIAKTDISNHMASYMVDNSSDNTLMATLKVWEIPRYLLFNKNGELVQYRSFGPSTPEIRETFDRYLNN